MKNLVLTLGIGLSLVGCNCGRTVCDRSESLDMAVKAGSCSVQVQKPLGTRAACSAALSVCKGADEAALSSMLDCYEKVAPCSAGAELAWTAELVACQGRFSSAASPACQEAFSGVVGTDGGDGGQDAGIDAGRQPMTDGGGAIDLIVVADEADFALAWSTRQHGTVARWELHQENAAGLKSTGFVVGDRSWVNETDAGFGVKRSYFLVGLDSNDQIVMGSANTPDAGSSADAGCSGPLDCPVNMVCDLGSCKVQACQSSNTCPGGYLCQIPPNQCRRVFGSDGGQVPVGGTDGGEAFPKPFVSDKLTTSTGNVGFSPEINVGGYVARGPALVAIDSARQYVALEQEGQLFGHLTQRRGKDLPDDRKTTFNIDTIGARPRLAYVASGNTLFACYNVGYGVRVRASKDLGRTWGTQAADISATNDAGSAILIQDCDIAPWRDGRAILVMREDEDIAIRTVSDGLTLGAPDKVFVSQNDGGTNVLFSGADPVVATDPPNFIVHVGFTASKRRTSTSPVDSDVYGAYRDSTTGGTFTAPTPIGVPNGFMQGQLALVSLPRVRQPKSCGGPADCAGIGLQDCSPQGFCVEPTALAAFTSVEGSPAYNTIYMALFNPVVRLWATGSDLTIFAQNNAQSAYLVLPNRPLGEHWNAFSPALAVTPAGRVFLSFIAGPSGGGAGAPDYKMYLVPFSIHGANPLANALGWYVPPAKQAGTTAILDPRPGGNAPNPIISAMAADSQLSVYMIYLEGLGAQKDVPNRAIYVSRP